MAEVPRKDHEQGQPRFTVPFELKRVLVGVAWGMGLSLLAVWLVCKFAGLEGFLEQAKQLGVASVVPCIAAIVLTWWSDTLRLVVLARSLGRRLSPRGAFRITMMSAFMAGVTPFDTGGEPLKVYLLHREGVPVGEGAAIVALAALLHATSRLGLFLAVPLVALFTGVGWASAGGVKAALVAGLLVYLVFLALVIASLLRPEFAVRVVTSICESRIVKKLLTERTRKEVIRRVSVHVQEFREGVFRFSSMRLHAAAAAVLSVAYWMPLTFIPYLVLRGMGVSLSYWTAFVTSMSVYLVMAYVPTPGSSGGAEIGSAALFARLIPSRLLGVFVLMWRAVTFYLTMAVGGFFLVREAVSWSLRKATTS